MVSKLVSSVHVSLDGFVEGPDGALDWLFPVDDDVEREVAELLADTRAILLGRVTYEGFAQYWPTATGSFADLMNTTPKVVFSRPGGLEQVEWGSWGSPTLVNDDVEATVRRMKEEAGGELVIFASAGLVASFTDLGLIDEYRLVVRPIALGAGKSLFGQIGEHRPLRLLETRAYATGSVLLRYAPA